MSGIRKIVFLLLPFIVLLSASSMAVTAEHGTAEPANQSMSEDNSSEQSVSDARGWYNLSAKGNEYFSSGSEHLQTEKKHLALDLVLRSNDHFKSFYAVYSLNRANSLSIFPFYIIYRRLTI